MGGNAPFEVADGSGLMRPIAFDPLLADKAAEVVATSVADPPSSTR